VNKWEWMKVVVTRGSPPPLDCEWYAWVPWDDAQIAALDLREVYRGPISGSILAVPRAVRRDTVERKN